MFEINHLSNILIYTKLWILQILSFYIIFNSLLKGRFWFSVITLYTCSMVFLYPSIPACSMVFLYPCIPIFLFHGISISLYPCIPVPWYFCIPVPLYPCIPVSLYPCILSTNLPIASRRISLWRIQETWKIHFILI